MLAAVYTIPAITLGKLLARDLNFWRTWKMCVAAQLPGSLIITFGLALYSTGQIAVVFVFVMFVAHFVSTLLYLIFSPLFLPRAELTSGDENPFDSEPRQKPRKKNPFGAK